MATRPRTWISSSRTRRTSGSVSSSRWASNCRRRRSSTTSSATATRPPPPSRSRSTRRSRPDGYARARSSAWPPSVPASRGRRRSSAGEAVGAMALREDVPRMSLRIMRREDLAAVLEIERRSFAQPWSRAFFEKELATAFARLVVAEEEESIQRARVVGYTCRWRVTDEIHLLNVAVHPERRGLGYGRGLVGAVVEEARDAAARVVFLEVRAGNVIARRLYRQLGFRDLGVRRGYYGPGQDAVVMELRLGGR